MPQNNHK